MILRLLQNLFCQEDLEKIRRLLLDLSSKEDGWVWHYEKKRSFNVESGYKLFLQLKLDSSTSNQDSTKRL